MPTKNDIKAMFTEDKPPETVTVSLRIPVDVLREVDIAKTGLQVTRSKYFVKVLEHYTPVALKALSKEELEHATAKVDEQNAS